MRDAGTIPWRSLSAITINVLLLFCFSCCAHLPCKAKKDFSAATPTPGRLERSQLLPLKCPATRPGAGEPRRIKLECTVQEGATELAGLTLQIKLTNVDDKTWTFSNWNTIRDFPTWVLKDGREVELTEFGNAHEPRWHPSQSTLPRAYISDRPRYLDPGDTATFSIGLGKMFKFEAGETYVVIVQTTLADRATNESITPVGYASFTTAGN